MKDISDKMSKRQKLLIFFPILLVTGLLLYSWIVLLWTDRIPTWRHYLGLGLFIPIIKAFFKGIDTVVVAVGLYLVLALFNLITLTPDVTTNDLRVGRFVTPDFQLIALPIFALYLLLNLDTLADIYQNFKAVQKSKSKPQSCKRLTVGLTPCWQTQHNIKNRFANQFQF